MDSKELLKKVRKIEIKTRALSNQVFSGEYHSAFKGRGMAFSEVREYQQGDDIRTIDWNVTARFNHPYVKMFHEERELNIMLLVDISASESFGTRVQLKKDLIAELCAVLAFSATTNNDKIGLILFSEKVERYIPPKKGHHQILHIVHEVLSHRPEGKGTDIGAAVKYFSQTSRRRSIAFIISDFIDGPAQRMTQGGFEDELNIASRRHDVVGIRVFDPREAELPDIGLVRMRDAETGQMMWVDTSNRHLRMQYAVNARRSESKLVDVFKRCGIDHVSIGTNDNYYKILLNLFRRRGTRR
ncbi:MAG: DUF58 domain-containing protein [Bacteroidota bacterium]